MRNGYNKRHLLATLAVVSMTAFGSTAAWAQPSPHLPGPPSTSKSDFASARVDLPPILPFEESPESIAAFDQVLKFGSCATGISAKATEALLSRAPNTKGENSLYGRSMDRFAGCAPTGGSFAKTALSLLRGGIAEAVYRKRHDAALTGLQPGDARYEQFLAGERDWNKSMDPGDVQMMDVMNCLAAQQPGLAHQIVTSEHGSAAETTALDSIFEQAPTCAGPQRQANLNRSFIRAYLAQALYRYGRFAGGKQ